jgi:hypothetical protein
MKFSASISGTKNLCKVSATDAGRRPQKKRMGAALTFLERYHRDGNKFLDHIVTGWNLGFPLHPWEQASVARVASSSIAFKTQEI